MVSLTVPMEESLKARLDKFRWVIWSEVGAEEIVRHTKIREVMEKLTRETKNSVLTDEDCILLGRRVRDSMLKALHKRQ